MSAPLPNALRVRFQKLVKEGLRGRAAALRLKLSPATGARWGRSIPRTGVAKTRLKAGLAAKASLIHIDRFLSNLLNRLAT